MIDDTLNQPAAPGAPIQPPQMQPQAPPQEAPQQAQAAPEPKQSVWKSVVQGALVGLANSGGATSFGGGLGAGAQGVMNKQRQDQQMQLEQQREARLAEMGEASIKQMSASTAATLATLAHQDKIFEQQSKEHQMRVDQHVQNLVKFNMDNFGMQYDVIPNSSEHAMSFLKQKSVNSPGDQMDDISGVYMSPSAIYVPKAGTDNPESQYEMLRKTAPLYGLPVPDRATFSRLNPQQRQQALMPLLNLQAGHGRDGEPQTIQTLPSAVAYLKVSLARYEKDPQHDPQVLAQGRRTLELLQAQMDESQRAAKERGEANRPGVYIATQSPTGEITGFYNNRNPNDFMAPPQQGLRKSPLPAQENADRASFKTLTSQFGDLRKIIERRKDIVGPAKGTLGDIRANWIGGDEEAADAYQRMDDIANQMIYLATGKQINEEEFKRQKKTFPHKTLPYDTFNVRLNNFEKRMKLLYKNRTGQDLDAAMSQQQQGGGMVTMKAPNGQTKQVPSDQVEFFKSKGATVVN